MQANVYVQFSNNQSLLKGLKLNNQLYKDKIIKVKVVDKLYENNNNIEEKLQSENVNQDESCNIYVTGLNGQLSELQD